MKCDMCGDPTVTVHLTEIINGNVHEVHLCEKCAAAKMHDFKKPFNMTEFLSELVDIDEFDLGIVKSLECSNCGLSYEKFKEIGRVGCCVCYETFKEQLYPLLRKIHSGLRHTGKFPRNEQLDEQSLELRINDLKQHLDRAIKIEEFESAARIRDEIKELETKINKNNNT